MLSDLFAILFFPSACVVSVLLQCLYNFWTGILKVLDCEHLNFVADGRVAKLFFCFKHHCKG